MVLNNLTWSNEYYTVRPSSPRSRAILINPAKTVKCVEPNRVKPSSSVGTSIFHFVIYSARLPELLIARALLIVILGGNLPATLHENVFEKRNEMMSLLLSLVHQFAIRPIAVCLLQENYQSQNWYRAKFSGSMGSYHFDRE